LAANGGLSHGWVVENAGWSVNRFIPGFNTEASATHYLNSSTMVRKPGNAFAAAYNFNLDVKNGDFLNQSIIAHYNSQCCGIAVLAAAGIKEIGIVVGDTHAEIRTAVGDGSKWNVRVTYIEQDAPRGLAHAVLISEPFIGQDPFVMYLGDNLLNKGITGFVEEFIREAPAAQILLTKVPDPQMFGVAELVDGRVVRLVEKPKEPKSDLALVGVYMFSPAVFDSVKRIKPSFRNELEITDAIQDLIDRALEVRPHLVDGWWKDTGKLEDMLEANRLILDTIVRRVDGCVDAESRVEGKVVIEAGAVVERSVIRGPVVIGADARIIHAYVRPVTSIGRGIEIRDTEIEHS